MSLMRIDQLFHFQKGVLQSSKCIPGLYNFITASSDWKTHNEYTHDCEALVFAAAASGSLGRTHYVNGKFLSSDLCFIITPKDPINTPINLQFYHLIFNELQDDIVKNTKAGTSKEAIGLTAFGKYQLPYFSITQQEIIKNKLRNLKKTNEILDIELAQQLNLIKKLRQQFLQDAVQGKLVEQNSNDESASVLLRKIKIEKEVLLKNKKIKQGKLQEAEVQNNLFFDVPNNWEWCKLDEICFNITDGTHQTPVYTKVGRVFLSAQNVKPFKFMPENHKLVSEEAYLEYTKNIKAQKGDLLIGRVGAGIGETAVINKKIDFCFYVSFLTISMWTKLDGI